MRMKNRQSDQRSTLVRHLYLQTVSAGQAGIGEIGLSDNGPRLILPTSDGARKMPTIAVNPAYFRVLGIRPARGRLFDAGDTTQPGRPALLSYAAWQQQFGGEEQIVGRQVPIGSMTFDIIGILPPGFLFPHPWTEKPELITLMEPVPAGARGGTFYPIVRLQPGVTVEQAQAAIQSMVAPLMKEDPNVLPVLDDVRQVIYPVGRPLMCFLLAAAVFVLLIGCANLSIMLLARTRRNEREMGVRAALGASRVQLVRPVFFEAALLSLAGVGPAVLGTSLVFETLLRQVPRLAYGNAPVGINLRVILFTLGLSLLSGFLFSVVPAWRAAQVDAQKLILGQRTAGRGHRGRLGRPMVLLQTALALTLVFGAILATQAFLSVLRMPLGFTPKNILTIDIRATGESGVDRQAFYIRVLEMLARRPDITAVGAAGSVPLDGIGPDDAVLDPQTKKPLAGIICVLPGYFETLRIPLLQGRSLNWEDVRGNADAAVLGEATARKLFPGQNPLGQKISDHSGRQFTVVGVVGDVRKSMDRESEPPVYIIPGEATRSLTLMARTGVRLDRLPVELKREIGALNPNMPIKVEWYSDSIRDLTAYRNPRFQTLVLGSFAGLALLLTGLGIFGVVSFSIVARTHEMAVRLALGATPRSLANKAVTQTLLPVTIGLVVGYILIRWSTRFASSQLVGIDVHSPAMLLSAMIVVVTIAMLAAYLSARRVWRVDPITVLRME